MLRLTRGVVETLKRLGQHFALPEVPGLRAVEKAAAMAHFQQGNKIKSTVFSFNN